LGQRPDETEKQERQDRPVTLGQPPTATAEAETARVPWPIGRPQRPTAGRAVIRLALASLVVAVALGAAGAVISRRTAQTAAVNDAQMVTEVLAHSVIVPNLTDALVDGDPHAIRAMDRAVVGKVTGGSLVRVKLWTSEGRIVYSDEHRLIGATYPLAADELEVLRRGNVAAGPSELSAPENRFEQDMGRLMEVYLPVSTSGGQALLFETYSRSSSISADAAVMWRQFLPITLGALLLLQLLQVPLAWSTARRLDRSQAERERLLRRAVEAADSERRRIACDLHEGVVQGLAAASQALVAARTQAAARGATDEAGALAAGERSLGRGIRALRTLLVRIYPPSLHSAGLAAALQDLLEPLAGHGFGVRLDLPNTVAVSEAAAELLYRVAQEAVRNAAKHSAASTIDLRLRVTGTVATMTVVDDGIGFDVAALASARVNGCLGLLLLHDLVTAAGGSLQVGSQPSGGTRVQVAIATAPDSELRVM
jgi:two-component system, NarL family, sensor kinase